ncbi:MAG: hypothetical protein HC867_09980 [Bacteroidia bacterium]|nr:hypothetical protein [Bacteroidia bacterium]
MMVSAVQVSCAILLQKALHAIKENKKVLQYAATPLPVMVFMPTGQLPQGRPYLKEKRNRSVLLPAAMLT